MPSVLQDLEAVFGEGFANTGSILNSPSSLSQEMVCKLAKEVELKGPLGDLGVFTANLMADNLAALSLRAADYSDPDLANLLCKRIIKQLTNNPEDFASSFLSQLRNRG
jgi:hypothetical protein